MNRTTTKKLLAAAMITALGVASGNAMAVVFNDFTVTETSVPGTIANVFTADKITGNYVEIVTFGAGTFDVSIKWEAGQFVADDGTLPVATQLGGLGANNYNMYTLFQSSGTFNTVAGVTTFSFGSGGSLDMFIDADQDTVLSAPASGNLAWTTANTADDILIATGSTISGNGVLDPSLASCQGGGINCGSFGTQTSFNLTTAGANYFTAPSPFYKIAFESGQLNNFTVSGTQTINGSLDAVFVPEPATLALMGLGLLGIGGLRRRKQA